MIRQLGFVLGAALPAAWSCGSGSEADSRSAPAAEASPAASLVTTATEPDGCALIPLAEIERIVGPIEGRPAREGEGCWYYFPVDTSMPEWAKLREWERQVREEAQRSGADPDDFKAFQPRRPGLFVEVDVSGSGLAFGQGVAAAREKLALEAGSESTTKIERRAGWDEVGAPLGRAGFTGRIGHVTVTIALQSLRVPEDTVVAMAARVRDRVPDRPFAHPAANPSASPPAGRDPCSLLTQAEAEAVLGNLGVPPFRTREGTPLADAAGTSCAYFTRGHRVLVLTPEWTYGKLALNAERMGGELVSQVADLPGAVADTLEGPWDDITLGLSGDLILLKGSRSLSIGYLMSSTDAAGAIKLGRPALERLAAEAEPAGPRVSAEGCPLSAALVSEIIEMPVRLFVNGTKYGVTFCSYALEADPIVNVELSIKRAEAADSVFAEIQSSAKIILGSSAQADRIEVGEGGWAFAGQSQSRAAAVARGKVYAARINDPLGTTASSRKDAMVRLVARMIE
jgi:hypothetical protein